MTIGTISKTVKYPKYACQSKAYANAGCDKYVMALNMVAYILKPAAHHGIRPPPKNNHLYFCFFWKNTNPLESSDLNTLPKLNNSPIQKKVYRDLYDPHKWHWYEHLG